jgi:hypothetical protein
MSKRNRKKNKVSKASLTKKNPFSIWFLFAIPSNFLLGCALIIALIGLQELAYIRSQTLTCFGTGVLGGLIIIGTSQMHKARTFIHELKHAFVVMLTGNRVRDFHFDTHTGHVSFTMCSTKLHFAPLITLAPYFFPMFSLPLLIVCILCDQFYLYPLSFALGFALASDISLGFTELHPHQSDLHRVPGGFIFALLYLSGFHLMWTSFVLVWVFAGRNGYIYTGYLMLEFVELLAQRITPMLSHHTKG